MLGDTPHASPLTNTMGNEASAGHGGGGYGEGYGGGGFGGGADPSSTKDNEILSAVSARMVAAYNREKNKLMETQVYVTAATICALFNIPDFVLDEALLTGFLSYLKPTSFRAKFSISIKCELLGRFESFNVTSEGAVSFSSRSADSICNIVSSLVDKTSGKKEKLRALFIISLLKDGCSCGRYGCHCTFGKLRDEHHEPSELFSKLLWETVMQERSDLTALFTMAIDQLKDEQKKQFCDQFHTRDLRHEPASVVAALKTVDRTPINPPFKVLLWLSFITSRDVPTTEDVLAPDYDLPDLATVNLTVAPTTWSDKLDTIIRRYGMTEEERAADIAAKAAAKAAEEAGRRSKYEEQHELLEDAQKILAQCRTQCVQHAESREDKKLAALIAEINRDYEIYRTTAIVNIKGMPEQAPRMDSILADFRTIINELETQLQSLVEMKEKLDEFLTLFASVRDTTATAPVLNAVRSEVLQFIIYGGTLKPAEQNKAQGNVRTCTLNVAIKKTKTQLTKLLFPGVEELETHDVGWLDVFVTDCLTPCPALYYAEDKDRPVVELFLNNHGALEGMGLQDDAFCWHCGECFGDIPEEMPTKPREIKRTKFKCKMKLLEHLVEIGSIDQREGSEAYNAVEKVSRIMVPCLLMADC